MGLYLGTNQVSAAGPGRQYAWIGPNVVHIGKLYEWNGTLDDTGYGDWTASTTASTILTAQTGVASFTIPDRSTEAYYVLTRWGMNFEYNSGATLTNMPIKWAYASLSVYYQYPSSTYDQIMSGDYTAYSNTSLVYGGYLLYYSSSGTASAASASYGPAYSTGSAWTTSTSGDTVTVTLNRPAISARCQTTYFATARKTEISSTNSTIKYRLDLFKGTRDDIKTHGQYKLITDICNNNWDI